MENEELRYIIRLCGKAKLKSVQVNYILYKLFKLCLNTVEPDIAITDKLHEFLISYIQAIGIEKPEILAGKLGEVEKESPIVKRINKRAYELQRGVRSFKIK